MPSNIPVRDPWSTEPVLELDDVTVSYDPADTSAVLKNVSVCVEEGEILLVIGRTGTGKTTLLNTMTGAMPHTTGGMLHGTVRVVGRDTRDFPPRMLADAVGVVGQDPQASFVTDTVEEELAYGMEQMGIAPEVMRMRVEETLDLLGIAELRDMPLRELSGGEQQRVALGAVLTARPSLIVMDEPTSALDPNGAEDVLATVTRLAHDVGVTVVIAEHRIERVLQYVDRVAHVNADGTVQVGSPEQIMATSDVAPPVVKLGRWAGWSPLPLSVRDARRVGVSLRRQLHTLPGATSPSSKQDESQRKEVLRASDVVVDFPGIRAVDGVSAAFHAGEITALMGRNGCGKSSLLWALQGTGKRTAGQVQVLGLNGVTDPAALSPSKRRQLVGLVPQTPMDLLCESSVGAELRGSGAREVLDRLAPGIPDDMHPRDLSEGQRLSVALAVQLAASPCIMLFDEPTRGLDYSAKAELGEHIEQLRNLGHAVVVATHDVEFAAACADRALVMAAGQIVADGPAVDIIASSPAYAPQVAKVTSGLHHESRWLTVEDIVEALQVQGRSPHLQRGEYAPGTEPGEVR